MNSHTKFHFLYILEKIQTSTLYNLAVIKNHIFLLLTVIGFSDECYDQVRTMVKILNHLYEADADDEVSPTSIVREFIGGNSFLCVSAFLDISLSSTKIYKIRHNNTQNMLTSLQQSYIMYMPKK